MALRPLPGQGLDRSADKPFGCAGVRGHRNISARVKTRRCFTNERPIRALIIASLHRRPDPACPPEIKGGPWDYVFFRERPCARRWRATTTIEEVPARHARGLIEFAVSSQYKAGHPVGLRSQEAVLEPPPPRGAVASPASDGGPDPESARRSGGAAKPPP